MNKKRIGGWKLVMISFMVICFAVLVVAARGMRHETIRPCDIDITRIEHINTERAGGSRVYFTTDVSSAGILAAFNALGVTPTGNVAIKMHFGEVGNQNFLRPDYFRCLTAAVNGTWVDANTIYDPASRPADRILRRWATDIHLETARLHGFTFAPKDILDAGGEVRFPMNNPGGRSRYGEAVFGANIMNYDWIISVSNFKGHALAGFGGVFKNLAIGMAHPRGKWDIHVVNDGREAMWSRVGNDFLEMIVDYNKALFDIWPPGQMAFINVLSNIADSCDCFPNVRPPVMPDIGVLASLDPVALDKASVDMIFAHPHPGRMHVVNAILRTNGLHLLTYAEQQGLGSQFYELIRIDR